MLEQAIHKYLAGLSQIAAIAGDRVFFGDLAAEPEPTTHIAYQAVREDWMSTMDGTPVDLQFIVVIFELRSESAASLTTLCNLLVRSLEQIATGATVDVSGEDVVIDQVTVLDGGTDEEAIAVTRSGTTVEILRRSVIAEFGFRDNTSPVT